MPRILIAEDEEALRKLLEHSLVEQGHEVVSARDGAEALDILTKHDQPFDLLLTDIAMPMMDGIALALAAARDRPGLRILLMTGYAEQHRRAMGLDALIAGIILKPFSMAQIREAVARALSTP